MLRPSFVTPSFGVMGFEHLGRVIPSLLRSGTCGLESALSLCVRISVLAI